jgi:hypothetical protein
MCPPFKKKVQGILQGKKETHVLMKLNKHETYSQIWQKNYHFRKNFKYSNYARGFNGKNRHAKHMDHVIKKMNIL